MSSSKQFCLKWTNFQNNILNAFESFQLTEDLTDVTLTCEGLSVRAHKFILSVCSPYFRTIFKENPCTHPIIILKDVLYADLVAIVNFMYHGEVLVSQDQLSSFLQTGKLLQVSGLNNPEDSANRKRAAPNSRLKAKNDQNVAEKRPKIPSSKDKTNCLSNETQRTAGLFDTSSERRNEENSSIEKKDDASLIEAQKSSILERSLTSNKEVPEMVEPPITMQVRAAKNTRSKTGNKSPNTPTMSSSSSQTAANNNTNPHSDETELLPIKIEEDDSCDAHDNYDQDENITEIDDDDGGDLVAQQSIILPPQHLQQVTHHSHHNSQCGTCPHCGKTYSNQSALKYHVRLVHSDLTNMHCCHLCPESFDYREGYKRHMIDAHCFRN